MSGDIRPKAAIVGAGLAGLTCGRRLSEQGYEVIFFDKGRAAGGRLATRRRDGFHFDHGAQYFTARDAGFRHEVERWLRDGIAAQWQARAVRIKTGGTDPLPETSERYVGVPGMSAVGRHLANVMDLRSGVRIAGLERQGAAWNLVAVDGSRYDGFDLAIVATPADQAVPLLQASDGLARAAEAAGYEPCWAVLLGMDEALPVSWDAAEIEGSPIAWAARNNSKPGRPAAEAWTLHCTPEWSLSHLEEEPAAVLTEVCAEFGRITGADIGRPTYAQAHRWRYARVAARASQPCLFDAELQLGACGDWCLEGRVEAAFLSGAAVARSVLKSQGRPVG